MYALQRVSSTSVWHAWTPWTPSLGACIALLYEKSKRSKLGRRGRKGRCVQRLSLGESMCILRIASRENVHMTCTDTLDPIIGRVHFRFSAKVEEVENRSKRSERYFRERERERNQGTHTAPYRRLSRHSTPKLPQCQKTLIDHVKRTWTDPHVHALGAAGHTWRKVHAHMSGACTFPGGACPATKNFRPRQLRGLQHTEIC